MTVLTHQDILAACGLAATADPATETTSGPIRPCLRRNVRSASYDLRLGAPYYLYDDDGRSEAPVSRLEAGRSEDLLIPPNEVVICQMHETLQLPNNVVGHLSLKLDVLLEGLIFANQSQIDAGYSGHIFALLYNLSSRPVRLKLHQPILRLELVQLAHPTQAPYAGHYTNVALSGVLRGPLQSTMHDLNARVGHSEARQKHLEYFGIALGFILAAAGLFGISELFSTLGTLSKGQELITTIHSSQEDQRQQIDDLRREWDAFKTGAASSGQPVVVDQLTAVRTQIEALTRRLDALTATAPGAAPPAGPK